jgi:uncharacterized membrane protein
MVLFILYRDERFVFDHNSNTWKYFYPVRWKLLVHATGGATALCLGALQFSTRLRQRHPSVHRLLGRVYIGAVLVAAPIAAYLGVVHGPRVFSAGNVVQASLWAVTTVMALLAARNRQFEVHRQWVMRSYAVTLIFVFNRILFVVPALSRMSDANAGSVFWILITCALLVPQLIINWRQLFAPSVPGR